MNLLAEAKNSGRSSTLSRKKQKSRSPEATDGFMLLDGLT
jgi:hypothetical protein